MTVVLDSFEIAHTDGSVNEPGKLPPDLSWTPACSPGDVHDSLIRSGLLAHPFAGDNEAAAQWVADQTWWYRTTFDASPTADSDERLRLALPSVDTVATIWLNDIRLGSHKNAFRPFDADVTELLHDSNTLVVRIDPPLQRHDSSAHASGWRANPAAASRRKPALSWGWDFAARLVTVGVLEPGRLYRDKTAVIVGHHIRVVHLNDDGSAEVSVTVEVDAFAAPTDLAAEATLIAPDGGRTAATLRLPYTGETARRARAVVRVPNAHLWWPHDMGLPSLYDVRIELRDDTGRQIDTRDDRVGLRVVELEEPADPDEPGHLFRFRVNRKAMFCRGANWVPASQLPGGSTPQRIRELLTLARDANMNMLRVWGGGRYEPDSFYATCDELGLLVWQDFMFACWYYPSGDLDLQQEVAAEADFQVRRLRNHPCIAIWTGNNEIHALRVIYRDRALRSQWGWELFHVLLPDAVAGQSPGAVYRPSSPWTDPGKGTTNGVVAGDRHAWEVWHGLDNIGADPPTSSPTPEHAMHPSRYRFDTGRFISEFGIASAPNLSTLRNWEHGVAAGMDALERRAKDGALVKAAAIMGIETGVPDNLEDYVRASMACQAEGLKYGIEHYRRRQPHCSGTLLWQLNDSWPGFTWSIIDYDLQPKAAYFFVRRAFAPVLASFKQYDDNHVELWVTSSSQHTHELALEITIGDLDGGTLDQTTVVHVSAPMTSTPVWRSGRPVTGSNYAWVDERNAIAPTNRAFFAPIKSLPLTAKPQSWELGTSGGEAELRITASAYSYFTEITTSHPTMPSDNYFDLRPGQTKVVTIPALAADAEVNVRSWGAL